MKKLLLLASVLLVGCGPGRKIDAELPNGLDDCSVYDTRYGYVFRCPETTTTTHVEGKVTRRTVVSNFKEEAPVESQRLVIDTTGGKIVISLEN